MALTSTDTALISASIASIALLTSMYSARQSRRLASSGFQVAEKVKSDTASFLAALRGLMLKGILYTQQDPAVRDNTHHALYIDTRPERMAIQTFLNSPTAIAYHALVAKRSKAAEENGQRGEAWRVFFLHIVELLQHDNAYLLGKRAARLEKLFFDTVTDNDFREISANLEDLAGSLRRLLDARSHDTAFHALIGMEKDAVDFPAFITFLRASGVKDPDVDLFWSSINRDAILTKDALRRGAKLHTTEGAIMSRYKESLAEFQARS